MTNFLTEIQLAVTLNMSIQIQGPVLKSTGITPDLVSHHSPVSIFQRATAERQKHRFMISNRGQFPHWWSDWNAFIWSWWQTKLILPSLESSGKTMLYTTRLEEEFMQLTEILNLSVFLKHSHFAFSAILMLLFLNLIAVTSTKS